MELSQRSLSLGIQTILLRAVGTVPGPVAFGFVMDTTCVLWRNDPAVAASENQDECEATKESLQGEEDLSTGSCLVCRFFSYFPRFPPYACGK